MFFKGVPYGPNDFTPRSSCPSGSGDIENYGNAQQVRNCKLSGMPDLYQGTQFENIAVFFLMKKLLKQQIKLQDRNTSVVRS